MTEHLKPIIREGEVKQRCHFVVADIFLKMRIELQGQLCCLQHNLTKVPVCRTNCFMSVGLRNCLVGHMTFVPLLFIYLLDVFRFYV
jgi:hypothetical protein